MMWENGKGEGNGDADDELINAVSLTLLSLTKSINPNQETPGLQARKEGVQKERGVPS